MGNKGDVLNSRGKIPSLRRGGLPGSFNLPKELRLSPLLVRVRGRSHVVPTSCTSHDHNIFTAFMAEPGIR